MTRVSSRAGLRLMSFLVLALVTAWPQRAPAQQRGKFNSHLPIQLASPLPELDAIARAETSWLIQATASQLNARKSSGHRPLRVRLASPSPLTFDALFVKNAGVFKDDAASWHSDLTEAQLLAKNTATTRVLDLHPHEKDGGIRYLAVTVSNEGARKLETKLLLGVPLDQVQAALSSGDWRVIDLEATSRRKTVGSGPFAMTTFVPAYHAVLVRNTGGARREQRLGEGTEAELHASLMAPLPHNGPLKQDWRVISVLPAVGMVSGRFVYVAERLLPGEWSWWKTGLRVGDPLYPTSEPEHVSRRLGARLIDLRRHGGTSGAPGFMGVLVGEGPLPLSGKLVRPEAFAEADRLLELAARGNELPGLSVAVVRDGKLVYARAIGHADVEQRMPLLPTDLLRIASVSKSIAGLATLRLMEEKPALTFSSKPFQEYAQAVSGKGVDASKVRLQDLMNHRSGLKCAFAWSGATADVTGFDAPQDFSCCPRADGTTRRDCGTPQEKLEKPCDCSNGKSVLREWTENGAVRTVQPGEFHTYYNGNYYLLGDLFSGVLGGEVNVTSGYPAPLSKYHEFVQSRLLKPLGLRRLAPSASLPASERESRYYVPVGFEPPAGATAELMRDFTAWSHDGPARLGGTSWAASMVDLVRLLCSADGSCAGPRILKPASWSRVHERPLSEPGATSFYGQGFDVALDCATTPSTGSGPFKTPPGLTICKLRQLSHGGYLPGTTGSALLWRDSGITIAYAMNSDLAKSTGFQNPWEYLSTPLEQAILKADVSGIDLFPSYAGAIQVPSLPPLERVPRPKFIPLLPAPLDSKAELRMSRPERDVP